LSIFICQSNSQPNYYAGNWFINGQPVASIEVPEGVTDAQILSTMRDKYNIMISGCFDVLAGKVIRIGHMGENARVEDMALTLDAMDKTLCRQYLRQGYAAAVLSKQNYYANIIKEIYMDFFDEEVYCFSRSPNGDSSGSSPNN